MSQMLIFWGSILRDMRKAHHLKQDEVASILHISRQDYSHIETGKVRPTPEIISILSNLYDKDLFIHALDEMPEALIKEQRDFKLFIKSVLNNKSDKNKGSDKPK